MAVGYLPGEASRRHGLKVRPTRPDDMDFLCTLYGSTRTEELAHVPWSEAEKSAFLASQFAAQHDHYQTNFPEADWLILECDGRDIGRLYIEEWDAEFRIIDIALMPDVRGRGLGTAVLQDILHNAQRFGKDVGIHVEKLNPAMTLYLRLGFEVVEDKGVYDLMRWSGATVT